MNTSIVTPRIFLKGIGLALVALSGIHNQPGYAASSSAMQRIPFSTETEPPRIKGPPNPTDCHHHICESRFPIDPKSALRLADATIADYHAKLYCWFAQA